jgi:hypothetical protein
MAGARRQRVGHHAFPRLHQGRHQAPLALRSAVPNTISVSGACSRIQDELSLTPTMVSA